MLLFINLFDRFPNLLPDLISYFNIPSIKNNKQYLENNILNIFIISSCFYKSDKKSDLMKQTLKFVIKSFKYEKIINLYRHRYTYCRLFLILFAYMFHCFLS